MQKILPSITTPNPTSSPNFKPTTSFFSAPGTTTTYYGIHLGPYSKVTRFRSHPHRSIREYLSEKRSILRILSIGQIIGESVYDCDFSDRIDVLEGVVAVDLDERFAVWKLGIAQSMAIKPAGVWELLDGMIV